MPEFDDACNADAPPEEVWKILYDPSRFPEWWAGIETVDTSAGREGSDKGNLTWYPEGYPDFPMPQQVETSRNDRSVTISCLVSDLRFEWRLEPVEQDATRIAVHVEIPEEEAHRLDAQRDVIARSLRNLTQLAEAA
jgi:uncharacterized protein YndB with AHSA1/START domain